jgi:hypothetical protein
VYDETARYYFDDKPTKSEKDDERYYRLVKLKAKVFRNTADYTDAKRKADLKVKETVGKLFNQLRYPCEDQVSYALSPLFGGRKTPENLIPLTVEASTDLDKAYVEIMHLLNRRTHTGNYMYDGFRVTVRIDYPNNIQIEEKLVTPLRP